MILIRPRVLLVDLWELREEGLTYILLRTVRVHMVLNASKHLAGFRYSRQQIKYPFNFIQRQDKRLRKNHGPAILFQSETACV